MAARAQLEEALTKLGQARAKDPPADQRKRDIMAQVLGDPSPPRRIGRFIDLGLLGHGAMGTVRRAYDERLGREVAIKLVRNRSTPQHDDRLLREAQALAQLSHPNVVQIYEVGAVDHEIFIAMELIDGVALDQWQRERHSWRDCLSTYVQAGRGLAAAHSVGLIHRDFKPANCIQDHQGRVRVLDFGLARAVDSIEPANTPLDTPAEETATTCPSGNASSRSSAASNSLLNRQLTANNSIVGTIAYMAPEQFVGGRVDAKSDQFSFCLALYEALHGRSPFPRDPRPKLVEMAEGAEQSLAFPATPRRIPRVLRHALQRGLAADPEARWPTMDALLRELQRPLESTRWRRLSMLALTAGGTAMVTTLLMGGDPCLDDRARLRDIWGQDQQNMVRGAFLATELPYAKDTWETAEDELDAYVETWEDASLEMCRASRQSPNQPTRFSGQQQCLERHRATFEYHVDLLSNADDALVENAVAIVVALPSIDDCENAGELRRIDPDQDSPEDDLRVRELTIALSRARTLDNAGRYSEGISAADTATMAAEALGDRSLMAEALLVEGHLLMGAGKPEAAEAKLEAAYKMALQDGTDEVTVDALSTLAHVVGSQLAHTEAGLRLMDFAINLAERPEVRVQSRALANTTYGNLRTIRGEFAQAETHFERALEILRAEHGDNHLSLITPLDGLAQALRKQGELSLALKYRQEALEIHRRLQGDQHPDTAYTASNMAAILYDQREYQRAQLLLEQAIPVLERKLGPDHLDLASPRNSLAAVLHEQQKYVEAEAQYRELIRIWEHAFGETHPFIAKVRLNLASTLNKQGRNEAAIEQYTVILRILDDNEATPENSRTAAQTLRDLGELHFDEGDLDSAEARYKQGVSRLESSEATQNIVMANLLEDLGDMALARGDGPKAEDLHLRAKAIYDAI